MQQVKSPVLCFRPASGVYALVDPRTNRVMYVGQSIDAEYRFRQHCNPEGFDGNRAKSQWIDGLRRAGLAPRLVILREALGPDSDDAERELIAEYRGRGEAELNRADGGLAARSTSRGKLAHLDDWFQLGIKVKRAREAILEASRAALGVAGNGVADCEKVIRSLDAWKYRLEGAMSRAHPGRPDLSRVFYGPISTDKESV